MCGWERHVTLGLLFCGGEVPEVNLNAALQCGTLPQVKRQLL